VLHQERADNDNDKFGELITVLESGVKSRSDKALSTYRDLYGVFRQFYTHVHRLLGEVDVQNIDRPLLVLAG